MASEGGRSGFHHGLSESTTGLSFQNDVRQWLSTIIPAGDAKHEPPRKATEPLKRNLSDDDDLALGVEASLYGKQGVRTVQDFLRWSSSSPALSRWNSVSSGASGHARPLRIMDILNLWNDDPEEFLLDLGFGCDEPDLSGRIPARFINYQSQARGINLQVFLEAQKSRMDLENPDVSNRFHQLEVLQQVTTAFSSLVGSSPLKAPLEKDLPPEARERRRRMGMLLRRASKKSLSHIHNQKALELSTPDFTSSPHAVPGSLQNLPSLGDKKIPLKRLKPGHLENVSLSPPAEELGSGPEPQSHTHVVSFMIQEGSLRPGVLREGHPLSATSFFQRKKNQWQGKESFEMEEIHSFDDSSVIGSGTGGAENKVQGLIRTNSCQSDSSGFLEEPFIPSLPQQGSPGSDLIKALAGLSGGSTDSHSSEKPGSPPHLYPHTTASSFLFSSLNSSDADKSFPACTPQQPPSTVASSSPQNLDCPFASSIAMSSESSSGSLGNKESESTEALHIPSNSASSALVSPLPSLPHLTPSAPPDFHCSSSEASPPLIGSLSQGPNHSQEDPLFQDSDKVCLFETPTEIPSSLSFQLHKDKPPALEILSCPSPYLFTPGRLLASSSQSHNPDGLTLPAAGKKSDLTELSQPVNTDPAPTGPVQDVIHVKMDDHSGHLVETLHWKGKGKGVGERLSDSEQTQDTDVYIPDMTSSNGHLENSRLVSKEVYNPTDPQIHQHIHSCSLQDELSAETRQEEFIKVCHVEINGTACDDDDIAEESSFIKANSMDLIKIESLDMVFETSVDGSEFENGEAEAFFQQLDTEGQVFWAEPIQISNSPHLLEELGRVETFQGSLEHSALPEDPANSHSLTGKYMPLDETSSSPSTTSGTEQTLNTGSNPLDALAQNPYPSLSPATDNKSLTHSVSIQMPSSPSSHIVHRRDVPYTDSKHTLPSSILPLDTSTPFRAVQSWTDLQIQRKRNLSHEFLNTVPSEMTLYTRTSEKKLRQTPVFSSTPSFPLQSNDWNSHDSLEARNYRTVSVSVDTGLSPCKEKDVNTNGSKDEKNLWEGSYTTTAVCCCSCDHQCTCCLQKSPKKLQSAENISFSLDELEEMMLCLQQFCSVLSNMEERLSEDQAAAYSALSDQDREKVQDIEELRRAVKLEATELEKQLNELALHYDDSLKMKMHRLLDEQSLLCSQLRVFLPGASNPSSSRTVSTQCCLMPLNVPSHMQSEPVSSWSSWKEESPRTIPPRLDSVCESLGSSPTKADKMDIVGFLQRLKESLHHSVNTD